MQKENEVGTGEWNRLVKDAYNSLEFLVTMHYLRKHLPETGKILDAGGGPGRYALEFCRAGYDVVLLDIDPTYITFAEEKIKLEPKSVSDRLIASVVEDVRDLSRFSRNDFDAVLCLGGPLTYISDETERIQAISELVRVAKPEAIVCIAVVGYLAMLRTVFSRHSQQLITPPYSELIKEGKGNNLVRDSLWHFFRASELQHLAESCGLITLEMVGCEGLSTGLPEATNTVAEDPAKWERWVELVLETATEPAIVDMAAHILYIGQVS
ncbi:MAG: class I SAM-dependent methyltransferase [Candidatus Poribacteria bacterium]|nr:class I SAM-dependent methyltransferase [Candidatus Poribacteria bacterium]